MQHFSYSAMMLVLSTITIAVANGQDGAVPQFVEQQQHDASIRPRFDPLPRWLTDSNIVPLERDRALQKLFYFKDAAFRRHADYVAQEIVVAMGGSIPPEETGDELTAENRERLNTRYARLLEDQIRGWKTEQARAEIRVEIVKRTAREQEREERLAHIAKQLADLERDAETVIFKQRLSSILKATGYVLVNGKVLPRDEAHPPFGYAR